MLEAVNDKEFRRAMSARDLLACRKVVPDVFEAVLPMVSDSDSAVRTSATKPSAGRCSEAKASARTAPRQPGCRPLARREGNPEVAPGP